MGTKIFTLLAMAAVLIAGDLPAQTVIYDNLTPDGGNVFYGGGTGFPQSRQLLGDDINTLAPLNAGDTWEVDTVAFNIIVFGNGVSQETYSDVAVTFTFIADVVTDPASGANTADMFAAGTVLGSQTVGLGDFTTGDTGGNTVFAVTAGLGNAINIGDGQNIGITFTFSDSTMAADNGFLSAVYRNGDGLNEPVIGTTSRVNFRDENLNGIIDGTDNFAFVSDARLRFSIEATAVTAGGGGFVAPSNHTVFRGVELSGATSDFADSDDVVASYNPGFVLNDTEAPVWLIFDGNAPSASVFLLESSAGTPGLEYTVEAMNFATGMLEVIGTQSEAFNVDQVLTFAVTADNIDTNGDTQSRVGWRQVGFTLNFPWQVNVDQVGWNQ